MTKEIKEVVEELDRPTTPLPQKKWNWRDPNISLVAFLGVSLLAASIMVGVGHMLYVTSDEYKLDITRPGLKDIKKEELVEVDRTRTYDSTSPVTGAAIDTEIKDIQGRGQELDRYGDFSDSEITSVQDSLFGGSESSGL